MNIFPKTTLFATIMVSLIGFSSNTSAGDYDYYESKPKLVKKVKTSIGKVFANSDGLTLYTFSRDNKNTSNCYDGCATNWPPFIAEKNSKGWGEFSVIERKDGTYQWAHKNKPLYTWIGDQKSGDTFGDGVGSIWFALKVK